MNICIIGIANFWETFIEWMAAGNPALFLLFLGFLISWLLQLALNRFYFRFLKVEKDTEGLGQKVEKLGERMEKRFIRIEEKIDSKFVEAKQYTGERFQDLKERLDRIENNSSERSTRKAS